MAASGALAECAKVVPKANKSAGVNILFMLFAFFSYVDFRTFYVIVSKQKIFLLKNDRTLF